MKYSASFLALALAFGLVGCGSTVTLPPVAPEQVEVFMPGEFPPEDYEAIAQINERVGLEIEDRVLIQRAVEKAARLGADVLLISAIRSTTEGEVSLDLQQEQQKILEALAVYYPSRHPELTGN